MKITETEVEVAKRHTVIAAIVVVVVVILLPSFSFARRYSVISARSPAQRSATRRSN